MITFYSGVLQKFDTYLAVQRNGRQIEVCYLMLKYIRKLFYLISKESIFKYNDFSELTN